MTTMLLTDQDGSRCRYNILTAVQTSPWVIYTMLEPEDVCWEGDEETYTYGRTLLLGRGFTTLQEEGLRGKTRKVLYPVLQASRRGQIDLHTNRYFRLVPHPRTGKLVYRNLPELPASIRNQSLRWKHWLSILTNLLLTVIITLVLTLYQGAAHWWAGLWQIHDPFWISVTLYGYMLVGTVLLTQINAFPCWIDGAVNALILISQVMQLSLYRNHPIEALLLTGIQMVILLFHFWQGWKDWQNGWNHLGKLLLERLYPALEICCIVILVFTQIFSASPAPVVTKPQLSQQSEAYETYLSALNSDRWAALSVSDRIEILQNIAAYEATEVLGCSVPSIQTMPVTSSSLMGYYTMENSTIIISASHLELDPVEAVLDTCLHELRHHWQQQVTEAYAILEKEAPQLGNLSYFDTARLYQEDHQHYESGSDYEAYAAQTIEEDSRYWARWRIEQFYEDYLT